MARNDEVRIKFKIDSDTNEMILLNKEVNKLGKSFNNAETFANTFMRRINLGGHILIAYQALKQTFGDIASNGIRVNREFQNINNSLSTMIMVSSKNVDSLGNQLSAMDKQTRAGAEAGRMMEKLLEINAKTPHTFNQTAELFDAMYLGMRKVGASTEDMVEITEKLSIAVGNKVSFDAMLSAMDGLSTGTVEVSSDMGRFLNAIGLSNEEIKNSVDVVDLFKEKLSGFKAIESFDTRVSNLTNSFDLLSKTVAEPLFDSFYDSILPASQALDSLNKKLIDYRNNIEKIQDVHKQTNIKILQDELDELEDKLKRARLATTRFYNKFSTHDEAEVKKLELLIKTTERRIERLKKIEENTGSTVYNFDDTEIQDLIKNTLNPYETGLDKVNKKWETNFNLMQKNGVDTSDLIKAWTKDIADYDKKILDSTKKQTDSQISKQLSSWGIYYETIGNYEESWRIKQQQLAKQYEFLPKEELLELENLTKKEYFFNLKFNPILNDFKSLDVNSLGELEDFALETEWKLLLDDASQETINKVYALTEEKKTQLKQSLSFTPETTQLQSITDEWTLALELYPNKIDEINTHYLTKYEEIQNKNVDDLDGTFENFSSDLGGFLANTLTNSLTTLASGGSVSGSSLASSAGSFISGIGSAAITTAITGAKTLSAGLSAIPGWGIAAAVGGSLISGLFGDKEKVDRSEELVAQGQAMAQALIEDMGYGANPLDDFSTAVENATRTLSEFNNTGSGLSITIKTLLKSEEYQTQKSADLYDEFWDTTKTAMSFAFTETGAMYAGMAGGLKTASEEALATAKAARRELEDTLLDTAAAGLDYSLYSLEELNSLIREVDTDEYVKTVKAINDIAIEIKNTGLMTEEQTNALADLYSEENFINYQDAIDIKEAMLQIKDTILDFKSTVTSYNEDIYSLANEYTADFELENIRNQISAYKEAYDLQNVNLENFTSIYSSLDMNDETTRGIYDELGDLLKQESSLYIQTLKHQNEEAAATQKDLLDTQIEAQSKYLADIQTDINAITNIVASLDNVIANFKTEIFGNEYQLNQFYTTMDKLLSMSAEDDYELYSKELAKVIGYSNALFEESNFTSAYDMQYEQAKALNEFENMDIAMEDELDVLKQIEVNTANQVDILSGKLQNIGDDIANSNTDLQDYLASLTDVATGGSTTGDIITQAFQNIFGYTPDNSSAGFKYWENELANNPNITDSNIEVAIARGAMDSEGITKSLDYFSTNNLMYGQSLLDARYADGSLSDYEANNLLDTYGMPSLTVPDNLKDLIKYEKFKTLYADKIVPFAEGGIIQPTPTGTLGLLAEAGRPEVVAPLNSNNQIFGIDQIVNENKKLRTEVIEMKKVMEKLLRTTVDIDERDQLKYEIDYVGEQGA